MTERSAIWGSVAFLGLGLAWAAWAFAHGKDRWPVPAEAKNVKNPLPATEASLAAAKAIYLDNCEQCHGEKGKGDGSDAPLYSVKPADFTDTHMMEEMTDGEIFYKISEGRRPMPSFKKRLTEEQRWQLVNYVRTFAPKPEPAPKTVGASVTKKVLPHKHE